MSESARAIVEMRACIQGKVQGVGFRAATRLYAVQLGLKGQVKNLIDGSVEIIAQGEELQLKNLLFKLKNDFALDSEYSVQVAFIQPIQVFSDFRIAY